MDAVIHSPKPRCLGRRLGDDGHYYSIWPAPDLAHHFCNTTEKDIVREMGLNKILTLIPARHIYNYGELIYYDSLYDEEYLKNECGLEKRCFSRPTDCGWICKEPRPCKYRDQLPPT